ncbi:MAG: 5-oxoprolinase subunit PxpA [Desulfarculaceae bacterium]|nr:5-oxoprolinase subunit PxpA [Desulfarculaceae bacterium]MCF8046981.1 5-oxoprolinase subunit PxpA [Desulfarculaceae bacterium]MCF8063602.1 5-oxoprolinase subunit PxpA [Desulfarculaceae bacterium]MCF8097229.1 5-oxoprolinase subunit PxpA [Desulfarculaceae bacterium]
MSQIDLNCDMGESFGPYRMGYDQQVMKHITSANIACGWHAGDPVVMDSTVAMAVEQGVSIGAHPGYPDLLGFGRRHMECAPDELRNYVIYQVGALDAFCRIHGTQLSHVKPHGKLYLDCLDRQEQARVIAEAVYAYDPKLIYVAFAGARGDVMRKVASEVGLKVAFEAFPDRAYTPDGRLVPRGVPGAVVTDPAEVADIALRVATEQKMVTSDGTAIDLEAQTLCVHGDTPTALELVKSIRNELVAEGVEVAPLSLILS